MILYKYADEPGLAILENLTLKVTPPNQLNDPFELTPRSRNALTRRLLMKMIAEDPEHFRPAYDNWVKNEGAGQTFATFLQLLREMPRRFYSSVMGRTKQGLIDSDLAEIHKASEYMVILSLSGVNDSIPMWSHYADHHRGFVIGLDVNDSCFRFGSPLHSVKYRKRRVSFRPLEPVLEEQRLKKMIEMVLTKSRDWAYEKEYRLCYAKDDVIQTQDPKVPYVLHIWPRVIQTVVLGCCMRPEFEVKIRGVLAQRRFSHVRVLKATRHASDFKLDLLPA